MRKQLHRLDATQSRSVRIPSLFEVLEERRLLSGAPIYDSEFYQPISAPAATNAAAQSIQLDEFKEVALNLGGIFYYSPFWPFADALKMESRGFMQNAARDFNNTRVATGNLDNLGFVIPAGTYNAKPFQNSFHPTGAPSGLYTVTWQGTGDVTLRVSNGNEATLVDSGPNRRVYRITDGRVRIQVNNVATGGDYVRDIHAWMPDPTDPQNKSLEPTAANPNPFWHPQYIEHLQEVAGEAGYFRYMDWLETNASPQVNWADRRPANSAFANGNTNYKALNVPGIADTTKFGEIGVAWEWIIDLSNQLNVSPWICIPHAATDDYVKHVADMFAGKVAGQPGLNPGLKVYVEHSNEIWSNGSGFAQGDWASQQSVSQGITKPAFNGRRATEVFRQFDLAFKLGGPNADEDRSAMVVRVAAGFNNQTSYNNNYLNAMQDRADDFVGEPNYNGHVLALNTYFAGSSFIKYLFNDIDWLNVNYDDVNDPRMQEALDAWITQFSLNATSFVPSANKQLAESFGMKYLSYEGGPSLYTHGVFVYIKDGKIVDSSTPGASKNYSLSEYVKQNYPDDNSISTDADRFTKFVFALNQHPRMADVYAAQMQVYKARGLKTHSAFQDISGWNRNGQWGHKEYLGQTVGYGFKEAVKWQYLLDYAAEEKFIRDIDNPINNVPALPASGVIGSVFAGTSFSYDIDAVSLGDVSDPAQATFKLVAGYVPLGMTLTRFDGDTYRLSGTPLKGGTYKMMGRLTDADQDPAYAIYTFNVSGGTVEQKGIVVTEDAFAFQNSALTDINGDDPDLFAGTGDRTTYLKFDLRNTVAGNINSAILRLYIKGFEGTTTPTTRLLYLERTSDYLKLPVGQTPEQWTEDNLEYRYAPTSAGFIGTVKTLPANPAGWVEFDVTNYVKDPTVFSATDGYISLAVRGALFGGDTPYVGVDIASKEFAGGDFAPTLVLNQAVTQTVPLVANVDPISPNPRVTSVSSASVTFNRPVNGFDPTDIIFKKNGQVVTLSGVTLSTANNTTFAINGLSSATTGSGLYSISIKIAGSGIYTFGDATDLLAGSDTESWNTTAPTSIQGRYIFYNNSAFDGNNVAATPGDDAAIATDKSALRPGNGKATFSNYTSYSKGINGVIIDLANLPTGSLSEEDLVLKVGNVATPSLMSPLDVPPEITIRHGGGKNGSDRITLTWPDGTIKNTWLQVTLKATSNTGLSAPDVFYFGNAIGETGDSVGLPTPNTNVNASDMSRVVASYSGFSLVNVLSLFDINRDARINASDMSAVVASYSGFNAVKLIVV